MLRLNLTKNKFRTLEDLNILTKEIYFFNRKNSYLYNIQIF